MKYAFNQSIHCILHSKPCQNTCQTPCKKHTNPESVAYQQIKNNLKIINLCVESMIKRDRIAYQIRRLEISKEKGKNLYAHVKAAKGKSTTTGPVKDLNGVLRTNDQDMATAFGEHLDKQLQPGAAPNVDWSKPYPHIPPEKSAPIFATQKPDNKPG